MTVYHKPVLMREVLTYVDPQPHKLYVDATFGGGGHTRALLEANLQCQVIAFDWDARALDTNGPALQEEFGDRLELVWGSFSHMTTLLKKRGIRTVDGILADFGTSQYQIKSADGFSFSCDTPLDMRMSAGHTKTTAAHIVNHASEAELTQLLYVYGEEQRSRKIARAIVHYRTEQKPITTTGQLADIVTSVVPPFSRGVHPATKTFQALRIVVNDELNNIKSLLAQGSVLLKPGGKLVCISFHSLEDRLVKQFFKSHTHLFTLLTPKVVIAQSDELEENNSARSAKLRAGQRL